MSKSHHRLKDELKALKDNPRIKVKTRANGYGNQRVYYVDYPKYVEDESAVELARRLEADPMVFL